MGVIKEIADELIHDYREGGGYRRQEIFQRDVNGMRIERLQKLTRYFYKKTVPYQHNDREYLLKLIKWAVVERSKILDDERLEALNRHRTAVINKGPLSEEQLASAEDSGYRSKQRKRKKLEVLIMAGKAKEAAKKKSAAKEKSSEKSSPKPAKEKSKVLKIKGVTYETNHKFKLKQDAEEHPKFRKRGKGRAAAMAFKKARTFEEAVSELKTVMKGKLNDKSARKSIRSALRNLIRRGLLEGTKTVATPPKKTEKATTKKSSKKKVSEPVDKKDDKKKKPAAKKPDDDDEDDEEDDNDEDDEEDDNDEDDNDEDDDEE